MPQYDHDDRKSGHAIFYIAHCDNRAINPVLFFGIELQTAGSIRLVDVNGKRLYDLRIVINWLKF